MSRTQCRLVLVLQYFRRSSIAQKLSRLTANSTNERAEVEVEEVERDTRARGHTRGMGNTIETPCTERSKGDEPSENGKGVIGRDASPGDEVWGECRRVSWRKALPSGRAGSASGERDLFSLRWGEVAPAASLMSTCSALTLTLSAHALLLSHLSVRVLVLSLIFSSEPG